MENIMTNGEIGMTLRAQEEAERGAQVGAVAGHNKTYRVRFQSVKLYTIDVNAGGSDEAESVALAAFDAGCGSVTLLRSGVEYMTLEEVRG